MPELPEVEVLVQHLQPKLRGLEIRDVHVTSARFISPHTTAEFARQIRNTRFENVERRGKYLLFQLAPVHPGSHAVLHAHLGMTGRIYLQSHNKPLPSHTRLTLTLQSPLQTLVFHDPRGLGGCTLLPKGIEKLGPEPWDTTLSAPVLRNRLRNSSQAIKIKLLDQSLIAGIGNIYASEILHAAHISPKRTGSSLSIRELDTLLKSIRQVLSKAIQLGLSLDLDFTGSASRDSLFYYGSASTPSPHSLLERFDVYDRENQPCRKCNSPIIRFEQGARSTYYCRKCQR